VKKPEYRWLARQLISNQKHKQKHTKAQAKSHAPETEKPHEGGFVV